MPEFKEKPKMDKPKNKPNAILSQQAARRVKEKCHQQLDQHSDSEENETAYATDQVERVGHRTVDGVRNHASRPRQRQPKDRPKEKSVHQSATPTGQSKAEGHKPTPRPDNAPKAKEYRAQRTSSAVKEAPGREAFLSPSQGRPRNQLSASGGNATAKPPKASQRSRLLKERPRTVFKSKVSAPGKAPTPAPKVKPAAKATKAIKQTAQRHMKQQAVVKAEQAAKIAVNMSRKAAIAVAKAVTSLVGSLMGLLGGSVLLVILIFVVAIAAVANSPFGIFFAGEGGTGGGVPTISVSEAVGSINTEYNDKLARLQAGSYDRITLTGQAADWPDVLAVFASRYAAAEDGVDVAVLDADRVSKLTATFWDMTTVTSTVETIRHPDSDPDDEVDDSWTERILHITVTPKTAEDMKAAYSFTDHQISALDELLADRVALSSLAGILTITNADVQAVVNALPTDLSPDRRKAVETALQLVGKVNYFWGGKSYVMGWDSRWGQLTKVFSPGSPTTGTYRPFGLDCSGFLDWTLRNAGLSSDGHWYVGTNLVAVSQADALPGDMALYPDASHIGMVVGRDSAGRLLICHCSSGHNNVVVTEFAASGFTILGRPNIYSP